MAKCRRQGVPDCTLVVAGEADSALENLHRMAEKELAKYVDTCGDVGQPELPFNEFKSRLAGLTR